MYRISILFVTLLSGCAGIDSRDLPCMKGSFSCDVHEFVAIDKTTLQSRGDFVEVECPWHWHCPSIESIQPECENLIRAAVLLVNQKYSRDLIPIELSGIQYREGGGYVDTFEPGQEAADCYSSVVAKIPLKWQSQELSK
jgi:hypothetical protein